MQTSLPKIATVILAITAVSFMGMAVASYYGRPDPIAEMHGPEIDEFKFEANQTETGTTWTVTPSVGEDKAPKQKDNAYQALLEAYSHKTRRMQAEAQKMNDITTKLRDRFISVEAEQTQDVNALESRAQLLKADVDQRHLNLENQSVQFQKLAVDTRAVRDETTKRREDVIRLQSDLEELRTDSFRLKQQRLVLTDRLVRLELELEAIFARLKQIDEQTK